MRAIHSRPPFPSLDWQRGAGSAVRLVLAGLLLLWLGGCAVAPPTDGLAGPTALERVDLARTRGDDAQAAEAMREAAGEAAGSERARRLLIAAWLSARSGDRVAADELLLRAQSERETGDELETLQRAVTAELGLLAGDVEAAIAQTEPDPPAVSAGLEWLLNTRTAALAAAGRMADSMEVRAELLTHIRSPELLALERDRLWDGLQALSGTELRSWRPPPGSALTAWLDFALRLRVARYSPAALDRLLAVVGATAALPGADGTWLERVRRNAVEAPADLDRVAVLLPLSGQLAAVGEVVRTGILAAHYQATGPRPTLHFHDVGEDVDGIGPALERARADGADLIIGPLPREQVAGLVDGQEGPALPVLALNAIPIQGEDALISGFGVLPEHSARSAARHARATGQRLVAALTPATARGDRVLQAFEEELGRSGTTRQDEPGLIIVRERYQPDEADHSVAIRRLLALSDSDSRYRRLREVLDLAPEHRVRRRQDIQVVFMEAFTRNGQLLQPQLKFHQGGDLPILATEAILDGTPAGSDPDLRGITVFAAPALVEPNRASPSLTDIERLLGASPEGPLRALYYLGLDAYNLASELPRLRHDDHASSLEGSTGTLSVGVDGQVERSLPASRFGTEGLRLLPSL